jgi:hypothetical protein
VLDGDVLMPISYERYRSDIYGKAIIERVHWMTDRWVVVRQVYASFEQVMRAGSGKLLVQDARTMPSDELRRFINSGKFVGDLVIRR